MIRKLPNYFLFLALNKRFNDASGELYYLLDVEIADDRPMRVLRVHRGCILEIFGERYSINLVHIPLRETNGYCGYGLAESQ